MAISQAAAAMLDEVDFSAVPLTLAGQSLLADKSGALYWPDERTLVVADLHFEKASHVAARGLGFPPPYDTRATLARLAKVVYAYNPVTVIALGDSLHDVQGAERMNEADLATLAELQDGRSWWWVTGNHDPEIPEVLGGHATPALSLGGVAFRHEPTCHDRAEVAAHFHPAARVAVAGSVIRRPCFVSNGRSLILPAFGSFTGGLNVLDDAFAPIFGSGGLQVWVIGHEGVYPVASRQLRGE